MTGTFSEPTQFTSADRDLLVEIKQLVTRALPSSCMSILEIEALTAKLELPVTMLNFPETAFRFFESSEIKTVGDLVRLSESDLLASPLLARRSYDLIVAELASMGLRLINSRDATSKNGSTSIENFDVKEKISHQDAVEIHRPSESVEQGSGANSRIVVGDYVINESKPEWGNGKVTETTNSLYTIEFTAVGTKTLSREHVQLKKIFNSGRSPYEKTPFFPDKVNEDGYDLCRNCGQRTQFTGDSLSERVKLGFCNKCFTETKRTFVDKDTGEKRSFDELRTIDGIKSWYSPK